MAKPAKSPRAPKRTIIKNTPKKTAAVKTPKESGSKTKTVRSY